MPVKSNPKPFRDGEFIVSNFSNETMAGLFATFSTAKNCLRQLTAAEVRLYDEVIAELTYRISKEAADRPDQPITPPDQPSPAAPVDANPELNIPEGWELLPQAEQVRPYHKIKAFGRWEYVKPGALETLTARRGTGEIIIREKIGGGK